MKVPGSAADAKPITATNKEAFPREEVILVLVKGDKVTLTRQEAYALASQLIISLEVDENG